ncbi:helix-turn-helix domain-containing protein [[Enterobacter] lignolyticus]|uniref:DNA-binding protein n=1 Tax=[Enterobacter] lignolyticus TaxID=1334193 RepID=A0A806X7I2_9ENTR|nr:helix-turn-helix domain-containing protein [[Enterobacter] lignolyticus]ALR77864.1 DNA-binding protein [[Enterobacter] lignolyticus]
MSSKFREYRLARAWSQEQLAEMAGLSTRTVQRIENGEQASLETLSALAAVFEVSVGELTNDGASGGEALDERIVQVRTKVAQEGRFYRSVLTAVVVCIFLYAINRTTSPDGHWSFWVAGIWGALLVIRGLRVFIFGGLIEKWQQKRIQKILRR